MAHPMTQELYLIVSASPFDLARLFCACSPSLRNSCVLRKQCAGTCYRTAQRSTPQHSMAWQARLLRNGAAEFGDRSEGCSYFRRHRDQPVSGSRYVTYLRDLPLPQVRSVVTAQSLGPRYPASCLPDPPGEKR
ncbi:predicted protein [Histoplasma capsulatum G186AR]|uniref:Uncharacterized protein n=1 Tax=Ajellomyces capsulatus (strain G186AR / H82 / ATCC MYA-2454 / RMSCC 2432) TaxID=447093 RepID=C0NH84_AJECG|nr:uncharacterized protein HCBG_02706 [Histoplasma capsulatum G186AR]EEH09169.1 predicted protein [Histoplasma capsulatum G186AR]